MAGAGAGIDQAPVEAERPLDHFDYFEQRDPSRRFAQPKSTFRTPHAPGQAGLLEPLQKLAGKVVGNLLAFGDDPRRYRAVLVVSSQMNHRTQRVIGVSPYYIHDVFDLPQ